MHKVFEVISVLAFVLEHIHYYSLSTVGRPCHNPIVNEARCRKAARVINKGWDHSKDLRFVQPSGNGYDLPKGCIMEMNPAYPAFPRFVYWNPNGVALSNDPSFRTICYNPDKPIDGISNLSRNCIF